MYIRKFSTKPQSSMQAAAKADGAGHYRGIGVQCDHTFEYYYYEPRTAIEAIQT